MNSNELIKKTIIVIEIVICICSAVMLFSINDNPDTDISKETVPEKDVTDVTDAAETTEEIEETEETPDDELPDTPIPDTASDILIKPVLSDDWRLILVNKQHTIPEDYEINLVSINGSRQVDERIADDLREMLKSAREDGISLSIISAYRSGERQTSLFNNKIRKNMRAGMSYLTAYKEASGSVTPPGTSEHQLGLAVDILGSGYSSLTDEFSQTEAGIWLKDNCAEYGFILRYPEGKEYITGIIYEPWHFRYVGKKYAKEIMSRGITLEEYLEGN